ncbi:hypothetical protein ACG83_10450 [Frankia sp. R43]|uniref:helix-turn-helix transcriptional regulator n=1 Tax=Frankia sp. R43 TaxID=269536 RepID=UPI0006CA01B7|nr:DNA-binding protein [Frankia sp. R43]KPM55695.1 hypothetical protein ACG83_10450 [Frankia sp. R43]
MTENSDPLLTVAEVAALLEISPATWRSYVSRAAQTGVPAPDDPDLDRPSSRRSPRWRRSTIETWAATRRPPGRPRKNPEAGAADEAD